MILQAEAESQQSAGSSSNPTPTPSESENLVPAAVPAQIELPGADDSSEAEDASNVGGEESTTDWDKLFENEEREEQADRETAPPAIPDRAPQAEVAKPAATPQAPAVATPGAQAQPPVAQPAVASPPAVPATPAAPPTTEQVIQPPAKSQADLEDEARAGLEKYTKELETYYKLPEEIAEQYETEPQVVLPQLAAKLHIAIKNEVMSGLSRDLPQYFNSFVQVQQRESAAKTAFYSANPDLTQYESQVIQAGNLFRQLNPNATSEQAIKGIGDLVRVGMRLNGGAPAAGGGSPAAQPVQSSPGAPAGFRPATPGGGGPARPPAPANEFEKLALEFEREDQGI